jgi:membrane protease YdiL (CAAX protease family)
LFKGKKGIEEICKSILKFKFSLHIYLIAVLVVIVSSYFGTIAAYILGKVAPSVWISSPRKISTSVVSPVGEEIGWRGLLTPYLLQRLSILQASVITGFIWATWHLWYYVIPGAFHFNTPFWLLAIDCCGKSLWYTWFYRKSRSIFSAILFHFTGNLFYNIIPCAPSWFNGNIVPYAISSIIVLVSGLIIIKYFKGADSELRVARDFA